MSISQRKDGRYLVKYKDQLTKQWKQKSFRDLASAEAFEAETAYDNAENYRITVAESIVAYMKAVPHCAENVLTMERLISGPLSILATRYVDTLTRRDLETARDAIRSAAKRPISNYTINHHIGVIMAAWRWCASEDMLQTVPWSQYRKLPEGRHGTHCGDREEFMRIYNGLPPASQWAVRTLLALCCRPGKELKGVTWSCIDLDHATARIWMPKVQSEKAIHLPAWWVEEARPRRAKAEPTHPVCPGKRPNRPVDLKDAWLKTRQRIGAGHCPLYTARHLAASMMLESGADAAAVAAQLGHRDITTTGTYYIHASAKGQAIAAASLPAPSSLVQDGGEKGLKRPDLVPTGAKNTRNMLK